MASLTIKFQNSNTINTNPISINRARFILNRIYDRVKSLFSYDNTSKTQDYALIENSGEKILEISINS